MAATQTVTIVTSPNVLTTNLTLDDRNGTLYVSDNVEKVLGYTAADIAKMRSDKVI